MPRAVSDPATRPLTSAERQRRTAWTFETVYERYARLVWRGARRLGVPDRALEDVVQDVFVVVYRRLADFEERASITSWLYAILIRVVRQHRRTSNRKRRIGSEAAHSIEPDTLVDPRAYDSFDVMERQEAIRKLYTILDRMDDQRREVFVLAQLEQLSAPEIAAAVEANVNTVYWRLRMARREFEEAVREMLDEDPTRNP